MQDTPLLRRQRLRLRPRLLAWLDHLAPRGCAVCGEALAPGTFPSFCAGCLADLPGARRPRCARCGHPTDRPAAACTACAAPADGPPPLDATLTAADYAPPLDRLVTSLKFGRRQELAVPLGELLAARWLGCTQPIELHCLVPVPLGEARLATRGFNQALEIARAMGAALGHRLPIPPRRLVRIRDTESQARLDLAARRANLAGCFASRGRFDGMTVGLVDDVMTSGSTLAEAGRALRAAGAQRVVALVATRTP